VNGCAIQDTDFFRVFRAFRGLTAVFRLIDKNRIKGAGVRNPIRIRLTALISAAPQTDTTAQGESYFFQTDGRRNCSRQSCGIHTIPGDNPIRTGMSVAAWIPEQGENRSGVIIPKSALAWYMDQAFVYIKTAEEQFSRRTIDQYSATNGGYFVGSGINAGEQLVVTGGQMLLSEEFRGQIPNEDD